MVETLQEKELAKLPMGQLEREYKEILGRGKNITASDVQKLAAIENIKARATTYSPGSSIESQKMSQAEYNKLPPDVKYQIEQQRLSDISSGKVAPPKGLSQEEATKIYQSGMYSQKTQSEQKTTQTQLSLTEIKERATLDDQKYISQVTNLPLATIQRNWTTGEKYSEKIGKMSYSNLAERGLKEAEKTGKRTFIVGTGDVQVGARAPILMYESSASLSTRPTYAQTRANYDYNVKAPKSPFITVFQEARDRFTGRRTSSFELTPGGIPKGGYSPKQVPIFTLPAGISSLGGIIYENTLKSGYTSTTLSPTGHGLITTTQEAGTKVYSIEMEEKPKPISDDMSELMPYNVGGINIWYNPEEGGRPAAEILAEYKETKTKEIIGKSFAEEARKYSKELEELRERKETPLKIGEPLVDWDKLFKAAEERHNVREFMLGFGAVSHGFATEFAISAEAMIPAAASTALSASNLIRQLTGQTRPYLIGGSSVEERIMFVEKPAYVLSTFKFPLLYEAAPTFLGHGAGVILKEASPLISKIPFLNKALATSEKGLGAYKGYNPFVAEKAGQAFFTVGMSAAGGIQSGFTEEGTFSFPRAAGGAAATFGILHTTTELIPSAGSKVFGALSERYGLNNPFVRAQIKPIGEAKQMVEAGVIPQSQLETGSDILKARAASLATEIKVLRGEKGSIIQGIKLPPKGFEFLSPQYRKIKWIESTIANKEKELNLIRKPTISRRSAEDNVKAWFGKEKYLEPEPKVKTYNILGRLVYLESKPFGLLGKEIEIPSGLVIGLKEAKFVPKTMAKSEMGELSTQGSKSITSKPSKHMPTGKLIEIQTTLVNIQTKPLHFIPQATATSQKISTGQANILKIIGTASKLKTKIPTTLAFGYSSVFAQARIQTQSTTQAQARAQAQAQAQAQTQTQAQAQAQALTQTLTQAQTQAQTLTMLTTKVPERPKTGLKFELYQFLSSSKRKKNKKIRIGSQYHPSIAAMLLGIRGKVQKGKVYTGLELRPIPLLKKRGKNNGKL